MITIESIVNAMIGDVTDWRNRSGTAQPVDDPDAVGQPSPPLAVV
jgi:hypothetical protein